MHNLARIGLVVIILSAAICGSVLAVDKQFADETLGYSLLYPSDWVYTRPAGYTVVFSGQPGTPAYRATVTIQNVASSSIGGIFDDVLSVVNDYKCQLVSGLEEICFYEQRPWSWRLPDGRELAGLGFTADYTFKGEPFRTMQVIFPHSNGEVFCSWAYSAPQEFYDDYTDIINAMFDSWTFLELSANHEGTQGQDTSASSDMVMLLEEADHIYRLANSDSEFNMGTRDKKDYSIRVPSPGYIACVLIDEPGQWIGVTVRDAAGEEKAGKAGTALSIYGAVEEVLSGTYSVEVAPNKFLDESDFQLYILFSKTVFTQDDLVTMFGDQNQSLQR